MTTRESSALMIAKTTTSRKGSREEALLRLVPKILGILCEDGQSSRLPSSRLAVLQTGIEVSACYLAPSRIMLSVYSPVNGRIVKVFSAHVTDQTDQVDPAFYRYVGGTVWILSWRRGGWEDAVVAHLAQARGATELLVKLKA